MDAFYISDVTPKEDGWREIVCTRSDAPDWVREMAYAAHDGTLPNNGTYDAIYGVLMFLTDYAAENADDAMNDCGEFVENALPAYHALAIRWLADDVTRASYVDYQVREMGNVRTFDLMQAIGWGMSEWYLEIYSAGVSAIQLQVEATV